MIDVEGEIWHWYHNISECYYHIQLTVKYRKAVLNVKVKEVIVETLKGFKAVSYTHLSQKKTEVLMRSILLLIIGIPIPIIILIGLFSHF